VAAQVEAGHGLGGIVDCDQWPWTWHRLLSHVRTVKGVYERAAYCKDKETAIPRRWMFWEPDELNAWFDERKE
jgi:hypothetical protein